MKRGKNFVLQLFIVALLAAPVLWGPGSTANAQEAYPVLFEATHRAVLSAERPGVLKSLKYDVGNSIKKGDVIAEVDAGELALSRKRSGLALKHLEVQVENLSKLNQRGLATNEEVAKALMERDITRTDIEIIRHQIAKSSIRAPYNCTVVRRHAQPHEWVTIGQPVIEVVDSSEIRAAANIPAGKAVGMEKGAVHSFYVHDLGVTVSGTVQAVAPEVDERSNTAQVIWTIESKEKGKVLPGMKGEVQIGQ